jgi:hypothetical protein
LRSGAETPLTDELTAEEVARAKAKEEIRAEEDERAWLAMAELATVQKRMAEWRLRRMAEKAALDEAAAAQARVEAEAA